MRKKHQPGCPCQCGEVPLPPGVNQCCLAEWPEVATLSTPLGDVALTKTTVSNPFRFSAPGPGPATVPGYSGAGVFNVEGVPLVVLNTFAPGSTPKGVIGPAQPGRCPAAKTKQVGAYTWNVEIGCSPTYTTNNGPVTGGRWWLRHFVKSDLVCPFMCTGETITWPLLDFVGDGTGYRPSTCADFVPNPETGTAVQVKSVGQTGESMGYPPVTDPPNVPNASVGCSPRTFSFAVLSFPNASGGFTAGTTPVTMKPTSPPMGFRLASPTIYPDVALRSARFEPATRRDEIVRSCLHGDDCGCATRHCNWRGRAVTMAGDCRACMAATVLAPAVARDEGWDYTVASTDVPDTPGP